VKLKTMNRLLDEKDGDGDDLGGGGETGEEAGFQDASAENLSDLLGEGWQEPTAPAARKEGIAIGSDPTPSAPPASVTPPAKPPVEPQTPPAQQPTEPQAQPPVDPQAQPQAQQPVQPAQPPVEPVQPPAAPEPAQPPAPQQTPEEIVAAQQANRQKFVEQLTQAYAIPEDAIEELRDSPEVAMPKLAAKLHADIFDSLFHGLTQQLPQLVDALITGRTTRNAEEERFFSKWSKLGTPELRPKALEKVRQYRQLNPTMPLEQFQHEAGMWAHMALQIPLEVPSTPGNGSGQPVPAAPVPQQQPRQQPFQPAGASSAAGGVPLAPQKNSWDAWVDEMAQDK